MGHNSYTTTSLEAEFDALARERQQWEQGSYKASNEELYALLEKCFNIYEQIRGKPKLCRAVTDILNQRKITCQQNTSLQLKIVRLVFGDCGKRALSYARVLTIASNDKPEKQSLHAFITHAGGIENMQRKKTGLSAAEQARKEADFASSALENADSLVAKFALTEEFSRSEGAEYDYCVALVRRDGNGLGSVVHASNSTALVREMLRLAAKSLKQRNDAQQER